MTPSVQWFRHFVQLAILGLIVYVAISSWNYSDQTSSQFEQNKNIHGNSWSTQIKGVSIVDPLAGMESIAASREIAKPIVLALLLPILITIILGRVFCSWMCPAGLLFELTDLLRKPFSFLGTKPRNIHFWRGHKYVLLVVGLLMSAWLAVPLLNYLYPPAIMVREIHSAVYVFLDQSRLLILLPISGALIFLFGIILLEVFVARRFWCRYLCPGGGLYSLFGKFRILRIRRQEAACTNCSDCVVACPMGLNPMKDQMGVECDNCQACISSCSDRALSLQWRVTDKR